MLQVFGAEQWGSVIPKEVREGLPDFTSAGLYHARFGKGSFWLPPSFRQFEILLSLRKLHHRFQKSRRTEIREGLQYCSARALHVFLVNGLLAGAEPIADTHRIFGNLDF